MRGAPALGSAAADDRAIDDEAARPEVRATRAADAALLHLIEQTAVLWKIINATYNPSNGSFFHEAMKCDVNPGAAP